MQMEYDYNYFATTIASRDLNGDGFSDFSREAPYYGFHIRRGGSLYIIAVNYKKN